MLNNALKSAIWIVNAITGTTVGLLAVYVLTLEMDLNKIPDISPGSKTAYWKHCKVFEIDYMVLYHSLKFNSNHKDQNVNG